MAKWFFSIFRTPDSSRHHVFHRGSSVMEIIHIPTPIACQYMERNIYGDNSDGVPLGCDLGWVNDDNNNCYYIQNIKRVTWSEANEECNRMKSMRLRIEDSNELKWFLSYVNKVPSDGYWTDLNDLPPDGSSMQGNSHWRWGSNEFPVDNLILWNISPQNDGISNCAGVNIQGKIEDTDCKSRQSYICEAPMVDGGCVGKGWLNSDIKCYWIANVTQPQEMISWDQARQRCNTLAKAAGFTGGDLLSINGNNDTTFLTGVLPYLTVSSKLHWIGLKYMQNTWQLVNGQPINNNYISWVAEPDNVGGIESCAMIRMNGNFSDQNCNSNHNFICKKPQNVAYEITNMGCGLWNRAGKKCYKFFDAPPNTWSDARDFCQAVDGDLLKVENKDEKAWITTQMMAKTRQYWVGLNDRAVEGTYVWADGMSSQSILIPWNQEPNDYSGQEDCGVIYHNGGYNDANCASQAAFICELGNQATCPMSWISRTTPNGLDCYYISDYKNSSMLRTWSEALDFCVSQAPDLTALPSLLAVDDADEKEQMGMFHLL
ncbi:hypothetical protein CHS0354_014678 [Potamilus streckersoni]|uniref:C-type lectin domain-containing protein n=1 Tax=Potamilus streckersoni TaxID=2493646 RepID=A0AAE0SQL6_9BIVA|nr:hypothetical protein CHS0354_014678 [Potamilus streckersoni]